MPEIKCPFCVMGPRSTDACPGCDGTGKLHASIESSPSGPSVVVELSPHNDDDRRATVRVDPSFDDAVTPRARPELNRPRILLRSTGRPDETSVDVVTADGRGIRLYPQAIAFEMDPDGGRLSLSFPSGDVEVDFNVATIEVGRVAELEAEVSRLRRQLGEIR